MERLILASCYEERGASRDREKHEADIASAVYMGFFACQVKEIARRAALHLRGSRYFDVLSGAYCPASDAPGLRCKGQGPCITGTSGCTVKGADIRAQFARLRLLSYWPSLRSPK